MTIIHPSILEVNLASVDPNRRLAIMRLDGWKASTVVDSRLKSIYVSDRTATRSGGPLNQRP